MGKPDFVSNFTNNKFMLGIGVAIDSTSSMA